MSVSSEGLGRILRSLAGEEHVVGEPTELSRLSGDLLNEPAQAAFLAVVPGTVGELCAVVRETCAAGCPIVARGAAMSYTSAHIPDRPNTVLVDTRRLNQIVEIAPEDLYVTVEVGCTWQQLLFALREEGVRTPFWGPLSGYRATVGGTLSQDAVFFGSAKHGTARESVLGFDVVRADGTLLGTGSRTRHSTPPFSRTFGPDLTGLFVGDGGALGIKARATLSLVPIPAITTALSFECEGFGQAVEALGALARPGIASEIFAFDARHHPLLAAVGMADLPQAMPTVHVVVEAADEHIAKGVVSFLREIGLRYGRQIAPEIPDLIRADPFNASRTIFSPVKGTLLPPVHAILPHSRGGEALKGIEAFQSRHARVLDGQGIAVWCFAAAIGQGALLLEVSLEAPIENECRTAAVALRGEIARVFDEYGAAHVQLGKFYEYAAALDIAALQTVREIKGLMDPNSLMNPGALGFRS